MYMFDNTDHYISSSINILDPEMVDFEIIFHAESDGGIHFSWLTRVLELFMHWFRNEQIQNVSFGNFVNYAICLFIRSLAETVCEFESHRQRYFFAYFRLSSNL